MNLKKLTTTGTAKVPTRTTGNQEPKEVVNADVWVDKPPWKSAGTAIPPVGIKTNCKIKDYYQ